jgi:hypothetical protein
MTPQYLQVNDAKVVHETIDDEVIIIHLESGAYYNLVAAGAGVWRAILQRASCEQAVDALSRAYGADPAVVRDAVTALLEAMVREDILIPAEPQAGTTAAFDLPAKTGTAFTVPELTKYTNMADLLLLDPIHDVDEQGWPRARAE